MNPGAGEPIQITRGQDADFMAQVSGDGKTVLFFRRGADGQAHLHAMNADGSNVRALNVPGWSDVVVSPDGSTIWFMSFGKGIFTMPTDGDQPRRIVDDRSANSPQISPDGKRLAYAARVGSQQAAQDSKLVIKVIPAEGGDPIAVLDRLPRSSGYVFYHDGNALVVSVHEGDGDNIVKQPLDGSKPVRLTNFKSVNIWSGALVDNGKTIVYSKGEWTRDAVMLTGF